MACATAASSFPPSLSNDKAAALGILSVFADDDRRRILRNPSFLHRTAPLPSPSSSSPSPALKLECSYAKPPAVKRQSAPIDIPLCAGRMSGHEDHDEAEAEATMVPPHVIVARRWAKESSTPTCMRRTLKRRNLRRLRDAVWRQIGFED